MVRPPPGGLSPGRDVDEVFDRHRHPRTAPAPRAASSSDARARACTFDERIHRRLRPRRLPPGRPRRDRRASDRTSARPPSCPLSIVACFAVAHLRSSVPRECRARGSGRAPQRETPRSALSLGGKDKRQPYNKRSDAVPGHSPSRHLGSAGFVAVGERVTSRHAFLPCTFHGGRPMRGLSRAPDAVGACHPSCDPPRGGVGRGPCPTSSIPPRSVSSATVGSRIEMGGPATGRLRDAGCTRGWLPKLGLFHTSPGGDPSRQR